MLSRRKKEGNLDFFSFSEHVLCPQQCTGHHKSQLVFKIVLGERSGYSSLQMRKMKTKRSMGLPGITENRWLSWEVFLRLSLSSNLGAPHQFIYSIIVISQSHIC